MRELPVVEVKKARIRLDQCFLGEIERPELRRLFHVEAVNVVSPEELSDFKNTSDVMVFRFLGDTFTALDMANGLSFMASMEPDDFLVIGVDPEGHPILYMWFD